MQSAAQLCAKHVFSREKAHSSCCHAISTLFEPMHLLPDRFECFNQHVSAADWHLPSVAPRVVAPQRRCPLLHQACT